MAKVSRQKEARVNPEGAREIRVSSAQDRRAQEAGMKTSEALVLPLPTARSESVGDGRGPQSSCLR